MLVLDLSIFSVDSMLSVALIVSSTLKSHSARLLGYRVFGDTL